MAAKVEVNQKLTEKICPRVDNRNAEVEPFASSLRLFFFLLLAIRPGAVLDTRSGHR